MGKTKTNQRLFVILLSFVSIAVTHKAHAEDEDVLNGGVDPYRSNMPAFFKTSETPQQCKSSASNMGKICGSISADMMGAAILTQSVAGGLQGAQNAAVAATGQALVGGTAAAMTYSAANSCIAAANKCIQACTAAAENAASGSDQQTKFTDQVEVCQHYASQAKNQQYIGMAQGLNAGLSGVNAYNSLSNRGGNPNVNTGGGASSSGPSIQPLNLGEGGGDINPSLPTPTNGMAYNKIDGASTGSPASGEGGGGGGFGGGGSYPGGAGGGAGGAGSGGGGSPLNNPTLGINGSSGGSGYSVSGVPLSGGAGGGHNYSGGNNNGASGNDKGFDFATLSKFLPGQERAPASEGGANPALQAQGITAGVGYLSNFEKVSRVMNQKRASMKH